MTRTRTKTYFFAILTALFICGFGFNAAAYEESVSSSSRLDSYSEEKIQELVNAANTHLNTLKSLAEEYQQKVRDYYSKSYSYQINEKEARRRAQNRQLWAEFLMGEDSALIKTEDERFQKLMNKTYKKNYSDFVFYMDTSSILGWASNEKKVAKANNITLTSTHLFYYTKYPVWDEVISRAQEQAAKERNPNAGAGKAIQEAQQISKLKDQIIEEHAAVRNFLMALDPSLNITEVCQVVVPEGEECPPGQSYFIVTNEKGRAAEGASKGCTPLPVRYAEIQACILCPLFQVILNTDQTMATKSYGALASSFRNVIIVALALFIAYQTLITVSAFTKQDAPKYISTLMVQGFKVALAAILLSNSSYIYHYVINPLMAAGLEFGLALLFDPNLLTDFHTLTKGEQAGMPPGAIGQDLLASIMAAVRLFSKASAQMPAIGASLICISTHEASNILPDFSMLIEGLLVFAFGWCIALACCFYLLDSVVRFGIFCALLPFLIACWPFKVTASYTKTGWDIFMNAFFNFVMMGMIISLNSELISQALTGGKGGMDALEDAINGSEVDVLKDLMDISGIDFLVLVACCMFAFKLVGQINDLANQVSGTSGGQGIGNKIGGAAAQAAKKVAGTAAKGGKAVAGATIGAVYEGTGAKGKVEAAKAKVQGGLAKVGSKLGLGPKSNPNGAGGGDAGGAGGAGGGAGGAGGGGAGGAGGK